MALDFVFSGDAVRFLRRLVDDIHSVFRLFVGGSKVATFHDVDAHETQEVPRDGIDLP